MDCPRCGARDVTTPECPACGVMVAKARATRPRPERMPPPGPAPAAAWRSLVLPAIGLVLLIGAAVVHLRQNAGEGLSAGSARQRPGGNASPPDEAALPEPVTLDEVPPAGPPPTFVAEAPAGDPAAAADRASATRLILRLNARV